MLKHSSALKIGIDFDNTIICYDDVFNKAALEKQLIPETLPKGKTVVRDYLRGQGLESRWIRLQGHVYGKGLHLAQLYDGVMDFLRFCTETGIESVIISHKTRFPYSGEKHDLHQAASEWIEKKALGIPYYFETTKEKKIERINQQQCTHFIDDLPEFLTLPGFSSQIIRILFDPKAEKKGVCGDLEYAASWKQIRQRFERQITI